MTRRTRIWLAVAFMAMQISLCRCTTSAALPDGAIFQDSSPLDSSTDKPSTDPASELLFLSVGAGSAQGAAIAIDKAGHIIIGGYLSDRVAFGPKTVGSATKNGIFVLKLNPQGKVVWATAVVGEYWPSLIALAPDSKGNIYIAGEFRGTMSFGKHTVSTGRTGKQGQDIYIARLTPGGIFDLALSAGADTYGGWFDKDGVYDIDVDHRDDVVVMGKLEAGATIGSYTTKSYHEFIAKMNPDGTFAWVGGPGSSRRRGLSIDSRGDIYVNGTFSGQIHIGPFKLSTPSQKEEAIWVAKVNGKGKPQWATKVEGGVPAELALDRSGNVYVQTDPGQFAKIGPTGKLVKYFAPCVPMEWANSGSMAVGLSGDVYLHGALNNGFLCNSKIHSPKSHKSDTYILRTSPDGTVRWVRRIQRGGAGQMLVTPNSILVTGSVLNYATFGKNKVTTPKNKERMYLWRFVKK